VIIVADRRRRSWRTCCDRQHSNTSDDPAERYAQGIAIMDDVLIAFDMLGWKVVTKDDPAETWDRYPILRDDDFRPDWCG